MGSVGRRDYVQYGCGTCAPESWTNFDASPTMRLQRTPLLRLLGNKLGPRFPANVRYGNIYRGLPVTPKSCTAIYCSHTLEHLSLEEFEAALRNTHSYLKPGGTFRFVLPDLERYAKEYLAANDADASKRFMEASYLGCKRREHGLIGMLRKAIGNSEHLWMWDYNSMSQALAKAGFIDIRRAAFGDSPDSMFKDVEALDRWEGELGMECRAQA